MPLVPPPPLGLLPSRLRWRLVLPVSLVVFAILVGYGADAARRQSELFESLIVRHGQGLARSIAAACSNAVLAQDGAALEHMLLNEMRYEQVLSLQALDATGHLVADVDRQGGQPTVHRDRPAPAIPAMSGDWIAHGKLPGRAHTGWHWHPVNGDLVIWATIPGQAGSPLGWIRATFDMTAAHDAQHAMWRHHLLGVLAALLLSVFGIALLSRGPIAALLRAREFALALDHNRGSQTPGYPPVVEIDQLFAALNTASLNLARQDEELQAGQRFLVGITETLGEGVYATDRDGRCTFMNREAERLTGWSREEMLGQPICGWLDFDDPDGYDVRTHQCTCTRAMASKEASRDDDTTYTHKDGTRFPISVSSTPLIENGEVIGTVVVFQDITLRKQAEQAMLAARQAAEAASRAKSDFLANMSHEIRTPLNAIIGMAHLTLNTELSPRQRDYLRQIEGSSRHLLGLVSDILDYSKIEAGKVTVEPVPFQLDALLDAATALHADLAADKPVTLAFSVERQVPRRLVGDFMKLKQVLLNYVGNAIKFTERGEIDVVIRVEARDEDSVLLHFEVRDTGIGMTEAQMAQLFQSFQQGDSSTTRRYAGTGLGLAICKRLAKLLGGEVGVASEYGRGSTFWFTARMKPDAAPPRDGAAMATTEAERLAAIAGARILLVEDNLVNQEVARHFVQAAGCTVDIADNGQVAVAMLKTRPPDCYDLVLMDMMMPVMDGLDACQALRRLPGLAELPVVAMTASTSESERARCLAAGMNDFLPKPFTPKDLWPILFRWIRPRHRAAGQAGPLDAATDDSI